MKTIEYKVRPITRFIITRYEQEGNGASSIQVGEFVSEDGAALVAKALAGLDVSNGLNARMAGPANSFDELIAKRAPGSASD